MISTPLFGVTYRPRKVSRLSTPLLGLGASTASSDRTPDPKFDSLLINAVDETMADLFGPVVVQSLHEHLLKFYEVRIEEIPYRLDTLISTLERTFGASSKTICKAIARKFYAKLGLSFYDNPGRTLLESVQQARIKWRGSGGQL
jgi:hypothetical protein